MTHNPTSNPTLWQADVPLGHADSEYLCNILGDILEPVPVSVVAAEEDEQADVWILTAHFLEEPDRDALEETIVSLLSGPDAMKGKLVVSIVPEVDWVAESLKGLQPIEAGRFYVHGSHDPKPKKPNLIPLTIDAGQAFGTGHHGTTKSCLLMLDRLTRLIDPVHILDMGCGSGILALAAAAVWKTPVLATDIDPIATDVTSENARLNQLSPLIETKTGPGFRSPLIEERGPYDVIFANILANPLRRMAPELTHALAGNGYAILSGILWHQEKLVLSAYLSQGLKLNWRIRDGDWVTLLVSRN